MALATTFWETFFLFLIFLPLVLVWVFALVDIFQREDLSGGWKAVWVACVILVPFFGTLVYLITRPGATREDREEMIAASHSSARTPADELRVLSDLHDQGKLTDAEFAAEKSRILGGGATAS